MCLFIENNNSFELYDRIKLYNNYRYEENCAHQLSEEYISFYAAIYK
jgi:hypothetical protein